MFPIYSFVSISANNNNNNNNNNKNIYRSEYDFIGAGFRRRRRVVKVEENRGFLVLRFDVIEDGRAAGGEGVAADPPTAG